MDMPAIISEYFPGISAESISEAVEDYQPAWQVIQHTWSNETLKEIMQGKVSVPDSVINEAIAESLQAEKDGSEAAAEPPVTELKLTSRENGRLEIFANTKKIGRVEFSGTIEEFVHNKEDSHVTYRVRERALKDHGLASWFFSRISMSLSQKLFGKLDLGESLPTTIKGNYITVDCRKALKQSKLAKAEIKGYPVLDMLEIKNAVPHDGYIMFETRLNIPQEIQVAALDLLLRRHTQEGN
ncbi:MAG: hypothetical protein SOV95_00420 [Anaerovibrio sp.]|uniref:hypothetical protein n=1 Tax=Anaerovibrio sp. TaxID=1872532 RepID=UPI00261737DB|nr:hypothetical protein [Anaerovibrio sp.]MDD7678580.1 hypothetical protein [Anaerovibrio sp.]MDY2602733.1 hypothetical protein [Anaerovibrio sp.]